MVLRWEGDVTHPEPEVSFCLEQRNDELADPNSRLNHTTPQSDPEDTPPTKTEIPSPPQMKREGPTPPKRVQLESYYKTSHTFRLLREREHLFVRPGGEFSFTPGCSMTTLPVITHTALQINGTAKVFLTRRDSIPIGEEKKVGFYRDLKKSQNLNRIINYLHFIKEKSIKRERDGES